MTSDSVYVLSKFWFKNWENKFVDKENPRGCPREGRTVKPTKL